MKVYYSRDTNIKMPTCAATVGFFDGVHLGHRALIEQLKTAAAANKLPSVVVTFAQHPRTVLHADFQPALLTSLSEKLIQLSSTGIDVCVVLDFTIEMSRLTARDFLKKILFEQFNVSTLLVGHDHRFGHNRTEGYADYQKHGNEIGMQVMQADRFELPDVAHVSSSEIRLALSQGNIAKTNRLLSYVYSFEGKVVNGFKVGRKIGFPTANLLAIEANKLIPATGVYAVDVCYNEKRYRGMMNIGNRPTFGNALNSSIEVNIFGFDDDIYNETLCVRFLAKIREEKKFDSVHELVQQLANDKAVAQNIYIDYQK
ncbi:MAG: riboflavin biosynthesis protein RibF [Porphyromonadaceae bacterium CG2_30_38_12]|nr:MAG: riboflavin biosynthesis protein RibF [Porphyromonadaceae bacterium CG2_30_38_12]